VSLKLTLPTAVVDLDARSLRCEGRVSALTRKEVELLRYLSERAETVSRRELLQEVWGYAPGVESRAVDLTVSRLRSKLEPDASAPRSLVSVRGRGYRLILAEPRAGRGPLLGRDRERGRLRDALQARRGVQLVGRGGVGKTALARDLAEACPARFVDLSGCSTSEGALEQLALALGLQLDRGGRLLDRVVVALGAVDELLVLDNVEQIDGAGDLVDALLDRGPTVVVTSRTPVSDRLPTVEVSPLAGEPARDLLHRAARRMQAGWTGAPEDLDAVVRLVEGLPLALELVGAQLPIRSVADLTRDVGRTLRLGDGRTGRHATLEASLRWSWDQLDDDERRHLCSWSCFAGDLDPSAVEAVSGPGAAAALGRLAVAGFVDARGEAPRLYPSVRSFCADRQIERGEREQAERAHGAWLSERMPFDPDGWAEDLEARQLAIALGPDLDLARVRLGPSEPRRGTELGLAMLVQGSGLSTDKAQAVATSVLAGAEAVGDPRLELEALIALLVLAARSRQPDADSRRVTRALDLAERIGDDGTWARLWITYGHLLRGTGDVEAALAAYRSAREHGRRAGLSRLLMRLDHDEGATLRRMGRVDEARRLLERCVAAARASGDDYLACLGLQSLAAVERGRGALEVARAYGLQAVDVGRRGGNDYALGGALSCLGNVLVHTADLEEAEGLLRGSVALFRRGGFVSNLTVSLGNLGGLATALGDLVEAELLYTEALQLAKRGGVPYAVAMWRMCLAELWHKEGRLVEARKGYAEAETQLAEQRAHPQLEHVRCYFAVLLAELGRIDEARGKLAQAAQLADGGPRDLAVWLLGNATVDRLAGTPVVEPLAGHPHDEAWAEDQLMIHTSWTLWCRARRCSEPSADSP